jgi:hypothetical protein
MRNANLEPETRGNGKHSALVLAVLGKPGYCLTIRI